jgi:TolB-like protein
VAVLPFRNATGSASFDALARGMPDLLAAMAGHARDVVVVERERLAALFGELGLEGRQDTGGEGALRLGRMLGAGVVVGGSLARVDATPRLVANAHVYDVKSSRVLQSVEVRGSLADLTALAAELAARLFEALDTPFAAPSPEQIDHSPEANLHFMRGLGYYYAGIPERAVAAFTRALATDAGHAAARYWNARAYLLLGDAGHAAIECRRLARDAPGDPRLSELRTLLKTSGGDTP